MKKNRIIALLLLLPLLTMSTFVILSKADTGVASADKISVTNVAGSYTKYVEDGWYFNTTYLAYIPRYSHRHIYQTTPALTYSHNDWHWRYIDSWCGPLPSTREESLTLGLTATANYSGAYERSIVKASAGITIEASTQQTVKKTYTFPGGNVEHTLYNKRKHLEYDLHTKRIGYTSSNPTVTVLPKITTWTFNNPYVRNTAQDKPLQYSGCSTQYNYGDYMTP